jgi:sugar-specific transcriptional regulator TrmB
LADEEVVKTLQSFGVLENEAEVYLLLTKIGSCSVGNIARRLSLSRMSVYRALRTLEEKGLVESAAKRPARYAALPIASFLNRCVEDVKTRALSMEKTMKEIAEYCERVRKTDALTEDPKFRIVQGRKHIHDQILKMFEKAMNEIRIIETRNGLYRFMYAGLDDKLRELHEKGVSVEILTHVDESGVEAVTNYLAFAQVRHTVFPATVKMILVDEIEALTTFVHDDSMSLTTEKDLAMWIRAPDYVKSMNAFFKAVWKESVLGKKKLAGFAARHTLMNGLDSARKMLEAEGWTTTVPGLLKGESGVEHSFDLVATSRKEPNLVLVAGLLSKCDDSEIMSFSLKALDVKPAVKVLVTDTLATDAENQSVKRRGVKLVQANQSRQVAEKILSEARKAVHDRPK